MLSLDDDLTLPLVISLYLGHPPSLDAQGWGLGGDVLKVLKEFGLDSPSVLRGCRGMCYDGAYMHCNVCFPFNFLLLFFVGLISSFKTANYLLPTLIFWFIAIYIDQYMFNSCYRPRRELSQL